MSSFGARRFPAGYLRILWMPLRIEGFSTAEDFFSGRCNTLADYPELSWIARMPLSFEETRSFLRCSWSLFIQELENSLSSGVREVGEPKPGNPAGD